MSITKLPSVGRWPVAKEMANKEINHAGLERGRRRVITGMLTGTDAGPSEPFHFGPEGQTPGLHPTLADYSSFASFKDPDGNGWLIQEVKKRLPGR